MKKFLFAVLFTALITVSCSLPVIADTTGLDGGWSYVVSAKDPAGVIWDYFVKMDTLITKDDDHPFLKKIDVVIVDEDKTQVMLFYFFTNCTNDGYLIQKVTMDPKTHELIATPFIPATKIKSGTAPEYIANIMCGRQKT